jgi:hypothetical protein
MPRLRGRRGATIVEVIMSVLLVASIAVVCATVSITGRANEYRLRKRVAAGLAAQRLLEELKGYVTADVDAAPGPGGPPNGWGLPGDLCGECEALRPGRHRIDAGVWMPELAQSTGTLSYVVSLSSADQPTVELEVSWRD